MSDSLTSNKLLKLVVRLERTGASAEEIDAATYLRSQFEQIEGLTHELNTLRAERNQMLEGLEALGWPCRLVELPAYAMKSDREIDRLRALLKSEQPVGELGDKDG